MTVTRAFKKLIKQSDPIKRVDEKTFLAALKAVYTSLGRAELLDPDRQKVLDALESLEKSWLLNQAAWGPRYLSRVRHGLPNASQTVAEVDRLRDRLDRMLPLLESKGPSTDAVIDREGITAKSLMNEAGIKKDTWQKIVNASGIQKTRPGEHSRRFSYAEVRKLAAAAKDVCPRIGEATSLCWLEMVKRNLND